MRFNLLLDSFFPIVTRSGTRRWISFAELADESDDAPVDFDWPRADFNIASHEFAIGVLTLAFRIFRESEWIRLWKAAPDRNLLSEKLALLAPYFRLDGDGPRFMQEFGGLDGEATPVEALLIDTPGENGQKKNADLLTHRARYPALGLPAAAMALYALQQFAPEGGRGFLVSIRGGGPLTTLVVPGAPSGERPLLWRVLLANLVVRPEFEFDDADLAKILPWIAPTLGYDDGAAKRILNERDKTVHPLQCYFGMPRRIGLKVAEIGTCSMTAAEGPLVRGYVRRQGGVKYGLWRHPLTPYRRQKEGDEPYSVKPKSGRFGYRDWISVTIGGKDTILSMPADNVAAARGYRRLLLRGAGASDASLRVGGWSMSIATALLYLAAEQPLHLTESDDAQLRLDTMATCFARAAEDVAGLLVGALRAALFSEGAKPSTDKTMFDGARAAFYDRTEQPFHETLGSLLADSSSNDEQVQRWLAIIRSAAFRTFDAHAPAPIDDPARARRIVEAFAHLRRALSGYGAAGATLYVALGLAPPEPAKARRTGDRNAG